MLMTMISAVGLIIGAIIFLNMLSTGDELKRRVEGRNQNDQTPGLPPRGDAARLFRHKHEGPRPRICPMCGTLLSQMDYLIAAIEPESDPNRKRQAQIYGCPYCFASGGVNLSAQKMEKIEP